MTQTVYEIHVKGQLREMVSDDTIKTYEIDRKPSSYEDARSVANDDFLRIVEMHVVEITTTKNLLHL